MIDCLENNFSVVLYPTDSLSFGLEIVKRIESLSLSLSFLLLSRTISHAINSISRYLLLFTYLRKNDDHTRRRRNTRRNETERALPLNGNASKSSLRSRGHATRLASRLFRLRPLSPSLSLSVLRRCRRRCRCRRHPHSTTRRPPIHSPRHSVLPAPIAGSCWHRCRCSGPFTRSTYTYIVVSFSRAKSPPRTNPRTFLRNFHTLSLLERIESYFFRFVSKSIQGTNAQFSYPAATMRACVKETRAPWNEQTVSGLNGRR